MPRKRKAENKKPLSLTALKEELRRDNGTLDLPLIVALGREKGLHVYYSTAYKTIHKLKPNDHTPKNFGSMADIAEWAAWLFPDKESPPADARSLWEAASRLLMARTGGKQFSPSCLRAAGAWKDSQGLLFNTGEECWLFPASGGEPEQVQEVRPEGVIYTRRHSPLNPPSPHCISREEGQCLLDFFNAHPWTDKSGGLMIAGWIAASVLSGYLPFRVHAWINAPAGTGKTTLRNDLERLLGGMAQCFFGAGTTEAAMRQSLDSSALAVLFDEAEENEGGRKRENLAKVLDLMRICTRGGHDTKGGIDGTPATYSLYSAFLLFSINNNLQRDADVSRCMGLSLRKLPAGEELEALLDRQEAGRAFIMQKDTPARFLSHIMQHAAIIEENAVMLEAHLSRNRENGRRAQLFGIIFAAAHAFISGEAMTQADLEAYAAAVADSEAALVQENDSERCFSLLMEAIPIHGGRNIRQLVRGAAEGQEEAINALERYGIFLTGKDAKRGGMRFLKMHAGNTQFKKLFVGSDWGNGNVKPVLSQLPFVEVRKRDVQDVEKARLVPRTDCLFIELPAACDSVQEE